MSWLLVQGLEYHCTECGNSFHVDFEGAPRDMQVGEAGIFRQMELNEKYGLKTSPVPLDTFSWLEAYSAQYLHEECICTDCYAANYSSKHQDKINATMSLILDLISQISKHRWSYDPIYKQECNKELDIWLNNIDNSVLESIDPASYSQTIGHRLYSYPANRKKLHQQYLTGSQNEIIEAARISLNESANLSAIVAQYLEIVEPIAARALNTINSLYEMGGVVSLPDGRKDVIVVFKSTSVKAARNLNQYICYENTMGIPASSMPDKYVYYLSSYSPVRLTRSIHEYLTDDVFVHSPSSRLDSRIDEKLLLKQLSQRLEQLNI